MLVDETIVTPWGRLKPANPKVAELAKKAKEAFPEAEIRAGAFADEKYLDVMLRFREPPLQIYLRPKAIGEEGEVHTPGREIEITKEELERLKELAKKYGLEVEGDEHEQFITKRPVETIDEAIESAKRIKEMVSKEKLEWGYW